MERPLSLGPVFDSSVQIEWSDGTLAYPRTISQSGVYNLTTSLDGCELESSIFIEAEDCSTKLFMPNAFSPNKDGINDTIFPLGENFTILQFSIYDRWGNQVHNSPNTEWSGTFREEEAGLGVYVYHIKLFNERLSSNEELNGSFSLLR